MLTAHRPRSTIMADVKDSVDWKNKKEIWARLPSTKSAVTRVCTAIDKLIDRQYTLSTPTEADEARKRLNEALDFCVEFHDRWSDLELLDGNESASETAEKSLKPYEEKQFAALEKLAQYVSENGKTKSVSAAASPESTSTAIPKLTTCKLLFPEKLTKSKTPCEFRLWVAASCGSMLRAASNSNQSQLSRGTYFKPSMLIIKTLSLASSRQVCQSLGQPACLDLLEAEFRSLYPILNRRVDFYQVRRDQGEYAEDFWRCLSKLGEMADLESMSKEDLTAFRFIDASDNKRLRVHSAKKSEVGHQKP